MRRILISLLKKVGLWKIPDDSFIEIHEKIVSLYAKTILQESELKGNAYSEAICEVKAFLWTIGEDELFTTIKPKLYEATLMNFIENVLFSSLDDANRTVRLSTQFAETRFDIYGNLALGSEESFELLYYLWFVKPFASEEQFNNRQVSASNKSEAIVQIATVVKNIVPTYLKAVRKLTTDT